MTQDQFSRRNIAKLALEGAVVVASILIAFSLDAWWAEKQLEQEIAEDLSIVEFELAENVRLVQVTMEIMNEVVAANKDLIAELMSHPDSALVDIEDTTIFWGIFSNPTLDPSLGAIDAWIAAGRLGGLEAPCFGNAWRACAAKLRTLSKNSILPEKSRSEKSIRSSKTRLVTSAQYKSYLAMVFTQGRKHLFKL